MSSLPPPPPPSQPTVPPPPYAAQIAPPPPPAPTRRTGLIVGAIAVAVALGVGAFVLLSGDDDESVSDVLPTSSMLATVQEIVGEAQVASLDSEDLDSCPGGDLAALAAQGPPEVQAAAARATETRQYVFQPGVAGSLAIINCTLDDSTFESGIGLGFGEAVDDYKADLIRVLPEFTLTFDAETPHLGGTLLRFCAEPLDPDAGTRPFCETDWFDDNVWVGVFLASDDTTSAITEEWLMAILPGVVNEAAASTASSRTATT